MIDDDPAFSEQPAEPDDGADEVSEHQTVDAADPKANRRRETRAKLEQREAEEFWRGIFADRIGRRELWRLLGTLHTFEQRFATGPNGFPQSEATFFHLGEQSVGQRLWKLWGSIDREGVLLMHEEHDHSFGSSKKRGK